MNQAYEELMAGHRVLRRPPISMHEIVVARLQTLAHHEALTDPHLPGFSYSMPALFAGSS